MFTLICWLFSLIIGATVGEIAVGLAEIMLFGGKFKPKYLLVMGILVGLIAVVYRLETVGLHIPETYLLVVIPTIFVTVIYYGIRNRSSVS